MEIKKTINPANRVMLDRSSIRKYDVNVKISKEEMSHILQDAMTAPSSLNLQPWRFFVIDSPKAKELIKPYMMFNELQWETSSAIIAIYADMDNFSETKRIYSSAIEQGLIPKDSGDKMIQMISSYREAYTRQRLENSVMLDCGFVGMQIMLAAKNYGYDTNPIGGFVRDGLTQALGLDADRYLPVCLISIGKAAEESHLSIRYSVSDVTEWK